MSDTPVKSASGIDLNPIAANSVGSPKAMYVFFLLSLCKNFFEEVRGGDNQSIERATAALVAFCPSTPKREEIWQKYLRSKETSNNFSAAVYAVGDLVSYLSETLEFEERSTGGLM